MRVIGLGLRRYFTTKGLLSHMKIKTVRINDKFGVTINQESDDIYVNDSRFPNAMGFYHFDPTRISDNAATIELLNCMILRHEQ